MDRRLAAILAADVVGYSRLMAENEEATLRQLKSHRVDVFDPKVAEHGGRIIKLMGDGTLVEFASVVDAVNCAVAIQSTLAEADRALRLRIGINLGDVIVDGDDIYGDGVNVAARLEALAEPGGVCISDLVHQSVRGKVNVTFTDIGEQKLKNIDQPIQAWAWYRSRVESPDTAVEVGEMEVFDEPTIAVLPFSSLSENPDREFFADGMADSIISTLAKMPYVRVIAHSSTQIYRHRAIDVREVGREQGASFVLDGTVKSAGDRLRITVQLSDCASGHHLWSEKYDRTVDDIFALQDEITFNVVLALDVELREGEQARLRAGNTSNLEAWEVVLQATRILNSHERDAWPGAKRMIERAITLDPDYAQAWTMLGWWHWEEAFCGWSEDSKSAIVSSLTAAERACQLDPANPEPYLVLAMAHLQQRDFEKAEEHMDEARRLGPNHAMVPAIGANVSMFCGRPEEALRQLRQAVRLSPIYPPWYAGDAAQACLQINRHDEAIQWARAAIKRDAGYIHAHLFLVIAHHELRKPKEADLAALEALKADPLFSAKSWAAALPFKNPDMSERFLRALIATDLPE